MDAQSKPGFSQASQDDVGPSAKKKQRKSNRQSMEEMGEKIDTLSNALIGLKEMFMIKNSTEKGTTRTGEVAVDSVSSEMTIYKNALQNLEQQIPMQEVRVDSEITFNKRPGRDSSSSEEKIDTSDELIEMEVDLENDLNNQLISDAIPEGEKWRKDATPVKGDGIDGQEKSVQESAQMTSLDRQKHQGQGFWLHQVRLRWDIRL